MGMAAEILDALARQGVRSFASADLYPFDQLHPLGAAATRALARLAGIRAGDSVLDLGCGIGGPARLLAAEFGAAVVGLDLSVDYVECARSLTAAIGLSGGPVFACANSLSLPIADAGFDVAWVQQSAMNIADKDALYRAISRSLKPGGRLALADCLVGPVASALHLPVPWARRADESHLVDEPTLRASLHRAGLVEASWRDVTPDADLWYRRLAERPAGQAPGAAIVFGSDFPVMISNLRRNLDEGRVRLIETVFNRNRDQGV